MTGRYASAIAKCESSGNYRLPDRTLKGLRHNIGIEAFFKSLKHFDISLQQQMMLKNSDRIISLMNKEKQPTVHAYFAYMLKGIGITGTNGGGYGTLMLRFLDDRSVFARENALKCIYSFGDAVLVESAVTHLSERGIVHNEKLLVDGLLSFPGDRDRLSTLLMKHYDSMLECYRNSLINFLSFASINKYDDILIRRAIKPETSLDTICCITRKMNKTKSDRSLRYLLDTANRFSEGGDWEPAAIAVTGLAKYPEVAIVKETLKKEVVSRNWYIRKNSAESLALIGITDKDLADIEARNDRYANEAVRYALMRLDHV